MEELVEGRFAPVEVALLGLRALCFCLVHWRAGFLSLFNEVCPMLKHKPHVEAIKINPTLLTI